MSNIINELTPPEKALLYSALLFFKTHSEDAFAHCVVNDGTPLYKEFFRFTEQSAKDLMQKLFAETFVDELDFIRHFNKHWVDQQNKKTATPTAETSTTVFS